VALDVKRGSLTFSPAVRVRGMSDRESWVIDDGNWVLILGL
jgi:hypothetical protein